MGVAKGTIAAAMATALLAASMYTGISAKEEPRKVDKAAVDLATADNGFGLDTFKKLHKEGENTFISPTSIATAMQMARQAAGGDTRAEMDKAMGLTGMDVPGANKALISELNQRKGVKLALANSLCADPTRVTMNEEYVKEVATSFDSEARAADFADPKTLEAVNGWISDKTNKLIPNMLDEIPASTLCMLINAIYFKGDWTDKFDKKDTKEADFHLSDGSKKTVQMMSRKDDIAYGEDTQAQFVKLPYGQDEQTAMWVVLPKEGTSLDTLVSELDAAKLKGWKGKAWEREGTLKLPRFKLKYNKKLNETLKELGINKAFKMGEADFTRLGQSHLGPIFIGFVLHEAVVIVNEEGTEAAAATIVGTCGGGAPPKPFSMTCDRPFLFLITDEPTGAIMFIGTCYNPDNPE